ncbi:MAG: hypothetical protein GX338_09745 [Firmicutes bacterium]|nr:hypothetical protein [Bacillota bacterium]
MPKGKDLYGRRSESYMPLDQLPGEARVDLARLIYMEAMYALKAVAGMALFPYSNVGGTQLLKDEKLE